MAKTPPKDDKKKPAPAPEKAPEKVPEKAPEKANGFKPMPSSRHLSIKARGDLTVGCAFGRWDARNDEQGGASDTAD